VLNIVKKYLYKIPGLQESYVQARFHLTYKKRVKMINKSPEAFIKYIYKKRFGKEIDLNNPSTFNEKLNWLKLNYYDPKAVICADKYKVRDYVKEKGLGFLLNDLIGVYESVDDIEFNKLPAKFVLKANHGSAMNIIVDNKNNFNIRKSKKKMKRWLSYNYSYITGEWVYHDIKPKIICESFIEDKLTGVLLDCKVYCFNGKPEMILVVSSHGGKKNNCFYDLKWNVLPYARPKRISKKIHHPPEELNKMLQYAEILADGFPFVRVDFYIANNKIFFGEMTFFPAGGLEGFLPDYVNYLLGEKIRLPQQNKAWA